MARPGTRSWNVLNGPAGSAYVVNVGPLRPSPLGPRVASPLAFPWPVLDSFSPEHEQRVRGQEVECSYRGKPVKTHRSGKGRERRPQAAPALSTLSACRGSGMSNSETPTMTTLSAHSGADFEAGRTGLPRGEQLEGRAVNDRREHLPGGSATRSPAAARVVDAAGAQHD